MKLLIFNKLCYTLNSIFELTIRDNKEYVVIFFNKNGSYVLDAVIDKTTSYKTYYFYNELLKFNEKLYNFFTVWMRNSII